MVVGARCNIRSRGLCCILLRPFILYCELFLLVPNLIAHCDIIGVSPAGSLRDIIAQAVTGDVIVLSPGLYTGVNSCNIIILASAIEIRGNSSTTVIDCSGTDLRHFTVIGNDCKIHGIQFLNGISKSKSLFTSDLPRYPHGVSTYPLDDNILASTAIESATLNASDSGGCLLITGSGTIVENSYFQNCSSPSNGGGISIQSTGGTTTLRNVTVFGSRADKRGGALLIVSSSVVISDSQILNNSALEGGGIYLVGSPASPATLRADNLTVSGNAAYNPAAPAQSPDFSGSGGGIAVDGEGTTLVVSGPSLLQNNSAMWLGGAVLARAGANVTLTGATLLRGNSVALGGGAVAVIGARTALQLLATARMAANAAVGAARNASGGLPSSPVRYPPLPFDVVGLGGAVLIAAGASASLADGATADGNTAHLGGAVAVTSFNPILRAVGLVPAAGEVTRLSVAGFASLSQNLARAMPRAALGCGGAVYGAGRAAVSVRDAAALSANAADDYGGAVAVEPGGACDLRPNGTALLAAAGAVGVHGGGGLWGNRARLGGAVFVASGALTLTGSASLQQNLALADGGAVLAQGGSLVEASGAVWLFNNTARGNGGGISAAGGSVRLSGQVSLERNSAFSGGAVYGTLGLSLSAAESVLFVGNAATSQGGGIYGLGVAVSLAGNVSIMGGTATAGGGVYVMLSALSVSGGVNFSGNAAVTSGGGAAIFQTGFACAGSVAFSSNTATNGAGVFFSTPGGQFSVSGRMIFNANRASGAGGGIVLVAGAGAELRGSVVFLGNRAQFGGGIYLTRGIAMNVSEDVSFRENVAVASGGAVYLTSTNLVQIRGRVRFDLNSAGFQGGAVFVAGGSVVNVSDDVVLSYNSVPSGVAVTIGNGGAFVILFSTVNFFGNVGITMNRARFGGALFLQSSTVSIQGNVRVSNNTAPIAGGIYFTTSTLSLFGQAALENNVASQRGGALFGQSSDLRINQSVTFRQNVAALVGGAICFQDNSQNSPILIVGNVTFESNSANQGGAIYLNLTAITARCCVNFSLNSADMGGAIFSDGGSVLSISSSLFASNSVQFLGGGIYMAKDDVATISASNFVANSASGSAFQPLKGGGGISAGGSSQLRIQQGSVFEGNTAISGGGILVADNSTVLVENSTFTANTAMSDGGGILSAHFSSTIISANSEFRNNYAERGGAMFSNGASISLVAPVIVAGNVAEVDGGAIFMYATVYLQRSAVLAIDFENNTAKSRGGSIFASGARAQLTLSPDVEVSFQNNSASLHGGALYLEDAASMKVAEETCIATCQSQIRGDGVCNPVCMTRGCNWDDGDCASLIANAAENSRTPCNRIDCPFSAQTVASASDGCYRFCFNSSCDWSRNLCQRTRNALANCPLFDLAAYESFLRPMFPPITYALGPSGAGRCINASDQCKASTRNDFKVTTPNTIVGDYAFDFQASWIYVPNTTELKSVQNASVEMWLKLHSNIALNGDWYLMSSPNMEIVLTNTPDLGKHISLRFRGVGPECYEAYSWPLFSSVWSHVAVVLASLGPNTSSTIMYLNGTLLPRIGGTCLAPPSIARILGPGFVGELGLALGTRLPLNGSSSASISVPILVDEVRIWSVRRSQNEISSSMLVKCEKLVLSVQNLLLCQEFQASSSVILDRGQGEESNGYVMARSSDQCTLMDHSQTLTAFGWCGLSKPLLPGIGVNYEPSDFVRFIQELSNKAFPSIRALPQMIQASDRKLPSFSGCATHPIRFKNNKALGGYGGAVYQSGCNTGLNAQGYCFFTGLSTSSGSGLVSFENNFASAGGGAAYTDCDSILSSCSAAIIQSIGVVGLQQTKIPRTYFVNNIVDGYGPNVATAPSQLVIPSTLSSVSSVDGNTYRVPVPNGLHTQLQLPQQTNTLFSYVPGQDPVDISLVLLDGLSQIIRGSSKTPLTYILVTVLCSPTDNICNFDTALRGPVFYSFDSQTGVCSTLPRQNASDSAASAHQTLVCPVGSENEMKSVNLRMYLSGSISPYLSRIVSMNCLKCRAGQSKTLSIASGSKTMSWSCPSCTIGQYVIDPNLYPCRKCPVGAICNGGSFVGKDGSGWKQINSIYRITSCPAGYIIIRDNSSCLSVSGGEQCQVGPEMDRCFKCPGAPYPGYFSRVPASYPGPLVQDKESAVLEKRNLCNPCPRGASCELGGSSVVPLPGYWTASEAVIRRTDLGLFNMLNDIQIYQCLPGMCLGANQCSEGHSGFICGICLPNYTRAGDQCVICDNESELQTRRTVAIVGVVAFFICVWYFIAIKPLLALFSASPISERTVLQGDQQSDAIEQSQQVSARTDLVSSIGKLKTGFVNLSEGLKSNLSESRSKVSVVTGVLKILLTFYQVTSCFWTAFTVPWPTNVNDLFKFSAILKADIFTIPAISCLSRDWDRIGKLLFYTVTPPLLVVVLGLPIRLASIIYVSHHKVKSPEFKRLKAKFYNAFLLFLFLIYPVCSIAILDIYNCTRIGSAYWLSSDLRVVCPRFQEKGFLFIWTVICTFFFPFGIPLIMIWGLYLFEVPRMAREKTEREALNAMLMKFQDDHKQDLLDEEGVDISVCSLIFSIIDRRHPFPNGVMLCFSRHGKITLSVFTKVLLEVYSEMELDYEEWQLTDDAAAIFAHFDSDNDGELEWQEFANLTCALSQTWQDDLTPQQIDALIHHRWGVRQPTVTKSQATEAKKKQRLATATMVERQQAATIAEEQRHSNLFLGWLFPAQPMHPRDRLLRHCIYLQEEEILSVGKTFWNETEWAPEKEKVAVDCMGFLFLSYKVEYWYFELIEQLRKLLMTSVIVFFYPGSLNQLAGGILITFLGLVLCFRMKPFMQPQLNEIQAACLSIQGVTLFYGVILIADNSDPSIPVPPSAVSTIILFLNIFVVFIPFIQFFVLRRPPFGERPLWERAVESCVAMCGFDSPFGRSENQSSGLHGRRMTMMTKLDFSLISENHIQSAAGKQGRPIPLFRQMSLKGGRFAGRRESMMSKSRRVSASGLDDVSRLRARRSTGAGRGQAEPSGKNLRAQEGRHKSQEPAVEHAQSEHHHANGHDGPSQHVTGVLSVSQPPMPNYMTGSSNISYSLDSGMTYYVPFEPLRHQSDLELDSSGWRTDYEGARSAYGVFPQPVFGTAFCEPAIASMPPTLNGD